MKKFLYAFVLCLAISSFSKAQSESNEFDKKWRFGLRITPQPVWFTSADKNNIPKGTSFGYGFGLNVERRYSDIISILTGIGGDFEGGKYSVKNDAASNYQVRYYRDESDDLVKPADGKKNGNTLCFLKERRVNTTFVTIPVILKLSTKEYNGLKYYGMFGGEIGIRIKATATDSYYKTGKYVNDTLKIISGETSETGVNLNNDASSVPIRVGFNVGAGAEYRLSGSTSAFMNVSFFRGLTPLMRKESNYLYYKDDGSGNYTFIKQNLFQAAVRISLGIMF